MHIIHFCIRNKVIVDSLECKVQFPNVYLVIFVSVYIVEGVLVMWYFGLIYDAIPANSINR